MEAKELELVSHSIIPNDQHLNIDTRMLTSAKEYRNHCECQFQ